MQYIKFTYVDAITNIPSTVAPMANGPKFPEVEGLEFGWARESLYPTNTPEFFGTVPDGVDTQVSGVLGSYNQQDYETMQQDELAARERLKPKAIITTLAFRNRFTTPEKVAIELAIMDNPSAQLEVRRQAAILRAFMKDVEAASFIDLERPDTVEGVQALEVAGLIAEGRAEEILTNLIQEHERPL